MVYPLPHSGSPPLPKLQVFDPEFGPPEADLWKRSNGEEGGFVIGAGGKFDVFSAGLLVMQMCFPPLANGASPHARRVRSSAAWPMHGHPLA